MKYIQDVRLEEEAYCESCYNLEPFSPVVEDGADYCLDCMLNGGNLELTKHEEEAIYLAERLLRMSFYRKLAESLDKECASLLYSANQPVLEVLDNIKEIKEYAENEQQRMG